MTPELRPGVRVRLTVRNRLYGYQPGDKGTLLRQITVDPSGTRYYQVMTDKGGPARTVAVFAEDEITADG
jgi:hypothetical protein